MARKLSGQVLELDRKGGRTFALRFRAYGKRRYVTLGTAEEGWTREKAQEELQNVLADIRRGIWRPPEPAGAGPEPEPTFHEFASEWFEGLRHEGLADNTLARYEWELSHHLLPFFAEHQLSGITIGEVDRYRQEKVRESVLNATSINATITRLAQILEVAVERELTARNPARGRRRRLKQRQPERTWLDRAEQIAVLLQAAASLDREARVDRRATPRRTCSPPSPWEDCGSERPWRCVGATSTSLLGAFASATPRPMRVYAKSTCCPRCAKSSRSTRRRRASPGPTTSSSQPIAAGARTPATYAVGSWPERSRAQTRASRMATRRRCRRT
jgi:hypothetical protein